VKEIKNINELNFKIRFFSVTDHILSSGIRRNTDIEYYIQCPHNVQNALSEFYTLLVDLKKDEQEIWVLIYHRTQTEISSFLNNVSFSHDFILNPDEKTLSSFIHYYNEFARLKKIRRAEKERLNAYRRAGILCLSAIRIHDEHYIINFYRLTVQRATNLHSFHLKHRIKTEHGPSFFGRAHRALHWLDMLEFKKLGVPLYDFCGWYEGNENKELLNINKFKEQFGGTKVKEFTGVIYHHPLLKFAKTLLSGIKR
jgi:hypothetical protein